MAKNRQVFKKLAIFDHLHINKGGVKIYNRTLFPVRADS